MGKHTPGPWIVNDKDMVEEDKPKGEICFYIADCHVGHPHPDRIRANALLIAAAPEMYAELDMIRALIEVPGDGKHVKWNDVKRDIDTLLAKIEGRE